MKRLQYEVLEQTPKCKDYYFSNEGMYSFWGDYLIAHVGEKTFC